MFEKEINVKMREHPDEIRKEALDYIEFLLSKYKGAESESKKFRFDWEGGLSELRDKFNSVDLQHKTLEWR